MGVGQYPTPAPSTQQAGRRAIDRPSTLLLMTMEFQEPATAITPMATHEAIPPTAAVVIRLNREDVEWAKYRSNNEGL